MEQLQQPNASVISGPKRERKKLGEESEENISRNDEFSQNLMKIINTDSRGNITENIPSYTTSN